MTKAKLYTKTGELCAPNGIKLLTFSSVKNMETKAKGLQNGSYSFKVKQEKNKWYYQVKAKNGTTIASSNPYSTKKSVLRGIRRVKNYVTDLNLV